MGICLLKLPSNVDKFVMVFFAFLFRIFLGLFGLYFLFMWDLV